MKKGQGEIFGIALLFVVLIVGIMIYGQFRALNPSLEDQLEVETRSKILAETTIDAIKKVNTGCEVERNRDSLEDLLRYCIENSPVPSVDPEIQCVDSSGSPMTRNSCSYAMEIFKNTLRILFTGDTSSSVEPLIGLIPYSVSFDNSPFEHEKIHTSDSNPPLDNLEEVETGMTFDNYQSYGYKAVSGGFHQITAGRRSIEIEFNLYYR